MGDMDRCCGSRHGRERCSVGRRCAKARTYSSVGVRRVMGVAYRAAGMAHGDCRVSAKYAKRRDLSEPAIVEALEACGCRVYRAIPRAW